MPRSAVAAPRTRRQQLQHGEAVDTVIMSAVAVRRRIRDALRSAIKAFREVDEAINELVMARDKEGEDGNGAG